MTSIDLSNLGKILLDAICENGLDKNIRKEILDNIEDKQDYKIACDVFNQTSEAYFSLGLTVWANLK